MKPEIISAGAAFVSALSALATTYLYRKQGKGFVWTKDQTVICSLLPTGELDLSVVIPIFNLGFGNVKFISLHVKKVYLKNNSIDNFELDYFEAYFPTGVEIAKYRTPIYTDHKSNSAANLATQFRIHRINVGPDSINEAELQRAANKKLEDIGEVLFVLKCVYRDGSWFGLGKKRTTIGMALKGLDLTFLSTARRKELDRLFA